MDRRDPEAWAWVLLTAALMLIFVCGWGFFVQWIIETWGQMK